MCIPPQGAYYMLTIRYPHITIRKARLRSLSVMVFKVVSVSAVNEFAISRITCSRRKLKVLS